MSIYFRVIFYNEFGEENEKTLKQQLYRSDNIPWLLEHDKESASNLS